MLESLRCASLTCKGLYSRIQRHDICIEVLDPQESVFLCLVHLVGGTAAAALVFEGAVAVPLVAGQRSFRLDWK